MTVRRGILFLLLLSLLALAATGQAWYSRLAYLWALVWLGNALWAWLSARGLALQRRVPQRQAHVGDVLLQHITVHNRSRWPALWVLVEDHGDLPGSRGNRVLYLLRGGEQRGFLVRTRLIRRGVYTLGPGTLTTGDVFGLFVRKRRFPHTETLVVYPRVVDLPTFPDPTVGLPGGEALRLRGDVITPNAIGVREYAPGDPLKRIHWPSTARRGRLMVKEFALDPQSTVWLALETRTAVQAARPMDADAYATAALWQTMRAPELWPDTLEYATAVAASVGRYFLRHQRAVGLWTNDPAQPPLPPERSPQQERKLFERLATLKASQGPPLAALLTTHARRMSGSLVVVITPWMDEAMLAALEHLRMVGAWPLLVALVRSSFGASAGKGEDETASLHEATQRGWVVLPVRCGENLQDQLTRFGAATGRVAPGAATAVHSPASASVPKASE